MSRPTDPLFDQRIADWLEDDPSYAPGHVLDTVLAALPSIPRRRAARAPRRFIVMPTSIRWPAAAAAVIGVLAIGGSIYLFQRDQPSVASPSSSPTLQSSPTPAPQSSPSAQMTVVASATTTLLADGRVLIAGGETYQGWSVFGGALHPEKYTYLDSAGLYDPATRTFTPTGSMATARVGHTATVLSDGRVLVAGGGSGEGLSPLPPLRSAELYDPATGTFTPTGPMTGARAWNTAVRLLDGRVLITGRGASDLSVSGEIYDPSSGTFSPTGPMLFGGFGGETATLLADGRVLFAGGDVDMGVCSASAEIFDPKTDTFSPTASMTAPFCGTATLLQDGRVLMTGREQWYSSSGSTNQASAEIFDPATGTFSPTGSPTHLGSGQTATLLADGRVVVAGGEDECCGSPRATADLYDPATGTFIPTGSMGVARAEHTATLLSDGRVLVTGGRGLPAPSGGYPWLTSAEIYDPTTGAFNPAGSGD
jgi:hypothetical protein